jgi:hypothetical protein
MYITVDTVFCNHYIGISCALSGDGFVAGLQPTLKLFLANTGVTVAVRVRKLFEMSVSVVF